MREDQSPYTWDDDMAVAGWQLDPAFHRHRMAAVHTVRSALPAVHARALAPDPLWGPCWPERVWRNLHDPQWVAFEWREDGRKPLLGLVRDNQAGVVPMDAWRWARHQENRPATAPVLPHPPAGALFVDFDNHFEAKWLAVPAAPAEPPDGTPDSTAGNGDDLLAHAQRVEAGVMQFLDEHWPAAPGESDWTAVASSLDWRLPHNVELAQIDAILRTDAPANFSLPAPTQTAAVKLAVRHTPFYVDAFLVRLVDLRGERTRITHFLVDTRSRTQLALGDQSGPIHAFNARMQAEERLCLDAATCTEYVRFFCEFVQGERGAFMVLRSADDMDWMDVSRKSDFPTAAVKPPRLRFFLPPRLAAEPAGATPSAPVVAVCLAYINYDRHVFVAGLVVHTNENIDMPVDNSIREGDWPIAPTLFDDEFQFQLSKARDTGDNPDVERRDALLSRRRIHAGLPLVLSNLPTGPGELDPCRLRRHVQIHDAIDLRGHELDHALLIHGVVFWGRVDLRSVTVKGDVDLTRCVFHEGLLLDDAEIQGSLVLHRVAASRISLRGVQVQGRLKLSEAQVDAEARADGADVQGDLDARGLSADVLTATGLRVRSDLRLGCRKGLQQGAMNNARLNKIDATNATVDGSVVIMQPGRIPDLTLDRPHRERQLTGWVPELIFTNATIKGSFDILPNDNSPDKEGDEMAFGCHSLLLRGARINGDLKLVALLVVDFLRLSHAEVGGNVELNGVWVLGRANLDDMRVAGWAIVAPYASQRQEGDRNLPLASRFDNGLDLALSRVARLVLQGVDCRGDLDLWGIHSASLVRLETYADLPCRVRALYPLGESHAGDLNAYGLSALQLDMRGVDVEGDIHLKGVDLLELLCRPALLRRPVDPDATAPEKTSLLLPRVAYFKMANARVRGNVELICIQVSGAQSVGECGLSILDSEIGGELLLTQSGRIDRLFLAPRHKRTDEPDCPVLFRSKLVSAIAGPVTITRCTVGAQLDLTGVQVDQYITLEDSRLNGDLILKAASGVPPARAASLDLRKLHCANDVDLTGLVLGDARTVASAPLLTASHAEVMADLYLCRHQEDSWTHAQIHGGIDFGFARLTHLVVHHAIIAQAGASLNLRHAQIARMEIPRSIPDQVGLPQTRLRGATIDLWDPDSNGDDLHKLYRQLLGSDVDSSPEVAAALERRLRLDGMTAVADSVYRYGYNRQFAAEVKQRYAVGAVLPGVKRLVRRAGHVMFKMSLGFGTQIYRLMAALFLVGVLALPITRSPGNFEASLSALAVPQDRWDAPPAATDLAVIKGTAPRSDDWSYAEASQLLLKNWLPMLPLHARDDWQPRGEGRTAWSWHGTANCPIGGAATVVDGCLPLAPEDWLNILQLLCWMGWPLLLTMVVRRVLRQ